MKTISYKDLIDNFTEIMDQVCSDHKPITITRKGKPNVVMISLEDYSTFNETMYLLESPTNGARLLQAISELEQGEGTIRELSL